METKVDYDAEYLKLLEKERDILSEFAAISQKQFGLEQKLTRLRNRKGDIQGALTTPILELEAKVTLPMLYVRFK